MNKFFLSLLTAIFMTPTLGHTEILKLNEQNTVTLRGEVDGASITTAQIKIAVLVKERGKATYPIYLVLDSPGGSIIAGLAFLDYARNIPNLHTVSIFAASMASAIAEGIPGKRYVTTTGIMMFHRAKGSFEGQFEDGEIESQLAFFKSIVQQMEVVNSTRMKLSLADYKAKVKDEYWLYGKKAVDGGAADEAVELSCDMELIESRENVRVEDLFGAANLSFSGCPLFRVPLPGASE